MKKSFVFMAALSAFLAVNGVNGYCMDPNSSGDPKPVARGLSNFLPNTESMKKRYNDSINYAYSHPKDAVLGTVVTLLGVTWFVAEVKNYREISAKGHYSFTRDPWAVHGFYTVKNGVFNACSGIKNWWNSLAPETEETDTKAGTPKK